MTRINWKKQCDELTEKLWDMTETAKIFEQESISYRKKYSALKGQLTRERKKNAEARELMELLEWGRNRVKISNDPTGNYQLSVYNEDGYYETTINKKSLLLALRAAKKESEGKK